MVLIEFLAYLQEITNYVDNFKTINKLGLLWAGKIVQS